MCVNLEEEYVYHPKNKGPDPPRSLAPAAEDQKRCAQPSDASQNRPLSRTHMRVRITEKNDMCVSQAMFLCLDFDMAPVAPFFELR